MDKDSPQEEGKDMATLSRANESVFIIDKDKTRDFILESKKNVISPEFLKRCLKFSKMLNKGK